MLGQFERGRGDKGEVMGKGNGKRKMQGRMPSLLHGWGQVQGKPNPRPCKSTWHRAGVQ